MRVEPSPFRLKAHAAALVPRLGIVAPSLIPTSARLTVVKLAVAAAALEYCSVLADQMSWVAPGPEVAF